MKQKNQVAVISIGSSEIIFTLVDVFDSEDGETLLVEVLVASASKADGMLQGKIVNPALFKESLSSALEQAREVYQWDGFERFILCFGGMPIFGTISGGMISVRNRNKEENLTTTLEMNHKVIEVASASPALLNRELLHTFLRSVWVDGNEPSHSEPVIGLPVFARLDSEVFLVACDKDEYKKYIDCVSECFPSHPIDRVIAAPIASSYAVLTPNEKQSNVMMVDIGAGTTDVVVYLDGKLAFSAVISLGGDDVTRAISSTFKCSIAMAEQVKTTKGGVLCTKDELDLVVSQEIGCEKFSVKKRELFEVMFRACEDIFTQVLESLLGVLDIHVLEEFVDNFAAGIVITGGSARIKNIEKVPHLLIRRIAPSLPMVPVRIGLLDEPPSPKKKWKRVRYSDSVSDIRKCPENAAAMGAILCHLSEEDYIFLDKKEPSEGWLSLAWRKLKDSFFTIFYT